VIARSISRGSAETPSPAASIASVVAQSLTLKTIFRLEASRSCRRLRGGGLSVR